MRVSFTKRAPYRPWMLVAMIVTVACGRSGRARDAEPAIVFNATSQPVAAVLRDVSRLSGVAIVLDNSATEVAQCVNISVITERPLPRGQFLALVRRSLESTPLLVQASEEGWVVRRRPDVELPSSCNALSLHEQSASALSLLMQMPALRALSGERGALDDAGATAATAGEAATSDERVRAVLAGIRPSGDEVTTITREALDVMLSNEALMFRQARVVPHMSDGRVRGMQVFGIRRASIPAALGLQNGDVLRSLNGVDLSTPESALEAVARIRTATELRLRVERDGQERALVYRIAPAAPAEQATQAAPGPRA